MIELIYNFAVLGMSILMFFMEYTASKPFNLIIKIIGKVVPLFVIGYAMLQIFKFYGLV